MSKYETKIMYEWMKPRETIKKERINQKQKNILFDFGIEEWMNEAVDCFKARSKR